MKVKKKFRSQLLIKLTFFVILMLYLLLQESVVWILLRITSNLRQTRMSRDNFLNIRQIYLTSLIYLCEFSLISVYIWFITSSLYVSMCVMNNQNHQNMIVDSSTIFSEGCNNSGVVSSLTPEC